MKVRSHKAVDVLSIIWPPQVELRVGVFILGQAHCYVVDHSHEESGDKPFEVSTAAVEFCEGRDSRNDFRPSALDKRC